MKSPTFWQGVGIAVALAVAGSIGMTALPLFLPTVSAWKLVTAGLAFGYILYLLNRSEERSGRIVVPCLFLLAALAGGSQLGVSGFVVLQATLIWLVRSLYHHRGLIAALADLGLSLLAIAAAYWALGTGSYLVSIWCFFLVQALFVWIPDLARAEAPAAAATTDFEAARRLADAALKRLAGGR